MPKTIIDNLNSKKDKVTSKSGGEGTAYFFENYILKKYHPFEYWDPKSFDGYFKELQKFYDEGCNIPSILDYKSMNKDECLLLQERLFTKEIYPTGMKMFLTIDKKTNVIDISPLKFIYAECEGFCSRKEFSKAIDKADPNDPLYSLIVLTYLKIFLNTTKKLEAINDDVLDKFILDDAYMTFCGKYGVPDIHAGNVFVDRNASSIKQMQIIDNFFLNGFDNECLNDEEKAGLSVYIDMFNLFKLNGELREIITCFEGSKRSEMERIVDENLKITESALLRFTESSRTIIQPSKTLSRKGKYICTSVAESISGKDGKLIKEIEKQFEM